MGHTEKGILLLAESDAQAVQLLFHQPVAIQVVGGLKGKERGHPHHQRA
jgi:hypothetical protein